MTFNFFKWIWISKEDLIADPKQFSITLHHEAAHSKQLFFKPFDLRRLTKQGFQQVELEATLNAFDSLSELGFTERDFLQWEIESRLISKYGVDLQGYLDVLRSLEKKKKKKR